MNETDAVRALAALAQAARLRIFRALVGAGPAGLTPGVLGGMLDIPGSTLSFHLKELIHAGLVHVQRDGRSLIYRPDLARMDSLVAYLGDHCCQTASVASMPTVAGVTMPGTAPTGMQPGATPVPAAGACDGAQAGTAACGTGCPPSAMPSPTDAAACTPRRRTRTAC